MANSHIAIEGQNWFIMIDYDIDISKKRLILHVLSLLSLLRGVLAKLPHFLNLHRFASNFHGLNLMIRGIIYQKNKL